MELKDVILSTLAEMEDETPEKLISNAVNNFEVKEIKATPVATEEVIPQYNEEIEIPKKSASTESELLYLSSIRERLLVLFEGFQAPNNKDIEAKVDMTLNFLEYVLATIDSRVTKLEKGKS